MCTQLAFPRKAEHTDWFSDQEHVDAWMMHVPAVSCDALLIQIYRLAHTHDQRDQSLRIIASQQVWVNSAKRHYLVGFRAAEGRV